MLAEVGNRLRIAALRRRGATIGTGVTIAPGASIEAENIVIGDHCHIGGEARLRAERIRLGDHCHIGDGCTLQAGTIELLGNAILFSEVDIRVTRDFRLGEHAKLSRMVTVRGGEALIGREFWMNPMAEIGGGGSANRESAFRAGDRCHIGRASHVNVADLVSLGDDTAIGMDCTLATHAQWQAWTDGYPRRRGPIRLGSEVALYSRSIIGPGVQIGDGVIVAAGSVVLSDIGPGQFVGGAPARALQAAYKPCDRGERLRSLFEEFLGRRTPELRAEVFEDGAIAVLPESDTAIVLAISPAADARVRAQRNAIVLAPDTATATALRDAAACVFDIEAKILHGRSSRVSEALRNFLFSAGLRFRYAGYQRDRLDHRALIASGLERP